PLVWLALVSLDTAGAATVNLRAPVVINPRTMLGCQVVAAENPYPLRHALARPAVS
ncbi:MAG: flagellar assembly protein FliW, partial [Acidobacteria bacterium]